MSSSAARVHIAAVVLHDGGGFASARWGADDGVRRPLNLAAALETQTRAPDSIIELGAKDSAGPQDLSRSLRSRLIGDRKQASRTITAGPGGVKSTHLWRTLERQLGEGFTPRYQWLWILSADSLPEPGALQHMEDRLFTVTDEQTHREIEIIGAKQTLAEVEEPRLINAGLWTARSGEVVTLTEPKELDQGQYDGRHEVPAVSAHGMLVHAGLFGDLGGFNPVLPADYAAADFCARAREVGARTVLEPAARIRRQTPPEREVVHRLGGSLWMSGDQRAGQIRTRLASASPLSVPFLWLGMWLAALLRMIALIACKAPDAAGSQFGSSAAALLNLPAAAHVRSFRKAGRRAALSRRERAADAAEAKELLAAGRRAVQQSRLNSQRLREQRRRDTTAETVGLEAARFGEDQDAAGDERALLEPGSAGGDFDQMPTRRSQDRLGLFLVLTVLTGVSLIGFRELLTAGALGGGAALPVSGSVVEVWHHTVSFLAADTLGERSAADPFTLVLLVVTALSFGHASAVLLWTVILAAPLSALTGWWAAGLWSGKAFPRVLAALIWGMLPALHTAAGQGRIGTVIAHILLPVVVLTAVRAVRARRRYSHVPVGRRVAALRLASGWETAAAAALLLAVVTAAAPVLLIPAVLICIVGGIVLGSPGRLLWLVPVPALAIFAPMLISALDRGANLVATLLSEPGRALSRAEAGSPAPLWQQLLGFAQAFDPASGLPGASGADSPAWLPAVLAGDFWALRLALLIGAPLLVIAVLAVLAAGQRTVALSCGLIGLGLLGYSAAITQFTAGSAAGELVPANPGPLVSAIALCLLAAALNGLGSAESNAALGGIFAPVAATLLVLSIFTAGVFWAAPRILPQTELGEKTITAVNPEQVLVEPGQIRSVPATAADQGTGPAATRTLILTGTQNGVAAEIVSGLGQTLDKQRSPVAAQHLPLQSDPPAAGPEEDAEFSAVSLRPSQQRLAELVAAVVVPGSEDIADLAQELGVGYLLVPQGTSLSQAADTAAGLTSVGPTDFGQLWRVVPPETDAPASGPGISGTATSWARIVTDDGEIVALLPSTRHRVDVDLAEVTTAEGQPLSLDPDTDHYVELATERAVGWAAHLDGQRLLAVTADRLEIDPEEMTWQRQFFLPAEQTEELSGQLTIGHSSQLQYPILIGTAAILLIFLLIAVPLPRSWRILPIVSDARLAGTEPPTGGKGQR